MHGIYDVEGHQIRPHTSALNVLVSTKIAPMLSFPRGRRTSVDASADHSGGRTWQLELWILSGGPRWLAISAHIHHKVSQCL